MNQMHILIKSWLKTVVVPIAFVTVLMFASSVDANAQRVALKTDALGYLTMSPNLSVEARLSRVLSLQLGVAANPVTRPIGGIKLTNFRVEPELRYWFNRPMARHFLAFSMTAGAYSIKLKDRYFSGDAVAAGISYGYALVLSRHWNMEAEIGVGIGTFRGYNYKGSGNKPSAPNFRRFLPVPIRFGLSFCYVFQ